MDSKQSYASDVKNGHDEALNADQYLCPRCEKTMILEEKNEHDDWHFAKDLEEQDGAASTEHPTQFAPPPHPPLPQASNAQQHFSVSKNEESPGYAAPSYPPPANGESRAIAIRHHTNQVTEAAKLRAGDEQKMQNALQNLQFQYGIYNSEIEPEHETDYYCNCPIHSYQRMKWARSRVQATWSDAVMYPGEKAYNDNNRNTGIFNNNPYKFRVVSPYGYYQSSWYGPSQPQPGYHAQSIHQTIALNNSLNREAQANIDGREPNANIWAENPLETAISQLSIDDKKRPSVSADKKFADDKAAIKGAVANLQTENRQTVASSASDSAGLRPAKSSKLASFRKSIGMKSTEEKAIAKIGKIVDRGLGLRNAILAEEKGRWPDEQWRYLVSTYQEKVGMARWIADLRAKKPTQYLHMLRAGYFEPIPVAWANQASNPLKFSIEASGGWRGITPAWRGYEDTAEERLYWVLNHREGSVGMRMKPDFISEMNMARARMATAVEPPPEYFSANDTCHVQHTSAGYSKQVMPAPFVAHDRPEMPTDDTMILLDVSGSMDFDPLRPNYNQYLITGYSRSTQPKNKGKSSGPNIFRY